MGKSYPSAWLWERELDNTLIPKSKFHRVGKDLEVLKINTSMEAGRERGEGGVREGREEDKRGGALSFQPILGFTYGTPTKEERT